MADIYKGKSICLLEASYNICCFSSQFFTYIIYIYIWYTFEQNKITMSIHVTLFFKFSTIQLQLILCVRMTQTNICFNNRNGRTKKISSCCFSVSILSNSFARQVPILYVRVMCSTTLTCTNYYLFTMRNSQPMPPIELRQRKYHVNVIEPMQCNAKTNEYIHGYSEISLGKQVYNYSEISSFILELSIAIICLRNCFRLTAFKNVRFAGNLIMKPIYVLKNNAYFDAI